MTLSADANELPAGWRWESLAEIAAKDAPILYGILQPGPALNDGVPYVRPTEIVEDRIHLPSIRRTSPAIALKYKRSILRQDDVVLSIVGTIGKVAIVPRELEGGNITQSSVRVRPRSELASSRYVAWALRSPVVRAQFDKLRLGTAVPRLNVAHVRELRIPLAPIGEQQRIVAEIEKQFTRLDAAVASLKRLQANLKRHRSAVFQAAVEGRLVTATRGTTRDSAREYESAVLLLQRLGAEHRAGRSKGARVDTEPVATDRPAELPEGWAWCRLEQLSAVEANSITDGPFGSNLKTAHYTDQGPRVIRLQNIGDGVFVDEPAYISEERFLRLQRHRVFAGDLVIAAFGADPPRSCIIPPTLGPALVKADCIRFKPHESVEGRYLNVALNSPTVRRQTKAMVHGVGRPRLNLSEIKSIRIPLPPLAEQHRIVAEVEHRLSVADQLEAVVEASVQRAKTLRQSILHRAFSGNL